MMKSHQEDDEIEDEEFTSSTPYVVTSQRAQLEGNHNNQKANASRSKHSETEQRRRSKINERFQILRDLIPENDQKRDKASFLLEVIHYIQFLQNKVQMYERTYQGWSSESCKLMQWKQRSNSGPVENFVDQPQFVKNGFSHEDSIVVSSALLSNSRNSVESDLSGAAPYRQTDHQQMMCNDEMALNLPVQPNLFEVPSARLPQGSFSEVNHLGLDYQPHFWSDKPYSSECAVPAFYPNNLDRLRTEDDESCISSAYSQELLSTLNQALQSSGVDLSQASISVKLDVCKQMNGHTTTSSLNTNEFSGVNK